MYRSLLCEHTRVHVGMYTLRRGMKKGGGEYRVVVLNTGPDPIWGEIIDIKSLFE